MANTIHKFENFANARRHFRENGITDDAEKYAWIKKEYTTVQLSMEQLREYFGGLFPGQDITVPDDQVERRAAVSEQVRHEFILMGVEHSTIPQHDTIKRQLSVLFRPEVDEASRTHNATLAKAVDEKDYATIAKLMEEFLQNLPSYDAEEVLNLPDEEVGSAFHALYNVYAIAQEAAALLSASEPELRSAFQNYSETTKERLAQLEKDSGIFAQLKLRCDNIADPHYAYIDREKLMADSSKINALVSNPLHVPSRTLFNYAINLNMGAQIIEINLGRNLQRLLENDGFDLSNTKIRDSFNRDYNDNHKNCRDVLRSGDSLYCTCDNQLRVFALEEGKLVEVNPAAALEKTTQRSEAALKNADRILNGSLADPFWMITGSSQYRAMKQDMANYQKLQNSKGGQDPEKIAASLEKMETSALAYLKHKNVDIEKFSTFEHFKARQQRLHSAPNSNSNTKPLSQRELARIEAAYSMLEVARNTASTNALRQELSQMPALADQQVAGDGTQQLVAPNRAARVSQMNQKIQHSSLLAEPVAPAGDNHAAENLRQQIQNSLFAPENGLLNKKFFTAQDRQQAETTLAQAVVLNVIRAGRKSLGNSPVPAEEIYQENPQAMLQEIKQSETFRNLVDKYISPDGLRRFLAGQSYAAVSKDFMASAAKQNEAEPQLQQAHQPDAQREMEEPIAVSQGKAPTV